MSNKVITFFHFFLDTLYSSSKIISLCRMSRSYFYQHFDSIFFKSSVCDLIIQASAQEPDIGLLVVNILSKDVSDPNPSVRSTAISTICCLPILLPHVQVMFKYNWGHKHACLGCIGNTSDRENFFVNIIKRYPEILYIFAVIREGL